MGDPPRGQPTRGSLGRRVSPFLILVARCRRPRGPAWRKSNVEHAHSRSEIGPNSMPGTRLRAMLRHAVGGWPANCESEASVPCFCTIVLGDDRSPSRSRLPLVRAGWIVLLIVLCAWLACEWESPPPRGAQPTAADWRRAKEGWVWTLDWQRPWQRYEPALHPGTVVAFLTCASLLALLGLPRQLDRAPRHASEPRNESPVVGHPHRPRAASHASSAGHGA